MLLLACVLLAILTPALGFYLALSRLCSSISISVRDRKKKKSDIRRVTDGDGSCWSREQTLGSCERDSPGHVRYGSVSELKWRPLLQLGWSEVTPLLLLLLDQLCVCVRSRRRIVQLKKTGDLHLNDTRSKASVCLWNIISWKDVECKLKLALYYQQHVLRWSKSSCSHMLVTKEEHKRYKNIFKG